MKLALSLLALVPVFLNSSLNTHIWVKYENKCASFTAEAREDIENDELGKNNSATSNSDSYLFMASALVDKTDMSSEGMNQQDIAKASLDAFEAALGASKVTRKPYYVKGNYGLDAEIEIPGLENIVLYRVMFTGQTQYKAVTIKKEGKAKMGLMKKVIGSFKF